MYADQVYERGIERAAVVAHNATVSGGVSPLWTVTLSATVLTVTTSAVNVVVH